MHSFPLRLRVGHKAFPGSVRESLSRFAHNTSFSPIDYLALIFLLRAWSRARADKLRLAFQSAEAQSSFVGSTVKGACGLFLIFLVCMCWDTTVFAQTAFVFEEPLRFNYSAHGVSANTVTFMVFSKQGTISQVSVRLRNIKDGDGQSLATDAVTPCFLAEQVCLSPDRVQLSEDGITVTLKLNPAFFKKGGEYHAIIMFEGIGPDQKPVKGLASPVIVHAEPEINVDQLKDQTLELYRWFPFCTAGGTFQLYLQETSGKSDLSDVSVSGQAIYFKDTKIIVPGQVVVAPSTQDPGTATAKDGLPGTPAGTPNQTGPALAQDPDAIKLDVHLEDLERAGSFETTLVVNSPSLSKRKFIPLRLTVSDIVIWPLLVILCGVIGGFLTSYLSGKWRAGQLNRRTILRLKSELSRFRQHVKTPENTAKIEALWRRLRIAEDSNELGDAAKVKTDLEQIEKDLADFRKEQVEGKAKEQTELNDLKNQIEAYRQQFKPLQGDEERNLVALDDRLNDAQRLLRRDEADYASEKLASVKALFADLKKVRLTNYLEDLERHFEKLKANADPADRAACEALIIVARTMLSEGHLEDAAGKLEELKVRIEAESDKSQKRAARGGQPLSLNSPPMLLPLVDRTRINIKTKPKDSITDRAIEFEIIDAEGLLQPGDLFRWNFGEAGSLSENGSSISYEYHEFGDYSVQVEVLRSNQSVLRLAEPLTVLPDESAQQSQKIRDVLQRSDLFLSLVALVLASLTGVLVLYVGKAFGSLSDYLLALLWGFGIDNSVRGFAAVMGKIRSSGGAE